MKIGMIITILLGLLIAGPAAAHAGWFHMGIKGGLNWADIAYDPEPTYGDYSRLMGFGGGVTLDMMFSSSLALETDILYMQKGLHSDQTFLEGGGETVSWEDDTKLSYIIVAPMLRFLVQKPGFFPYALVGAEVGHLLSAKVNVNRQDAGENTELDVMDYYSSTDYGLTFGGGLEFPTGSSSIFLEGRYALGLADIQGDDSASETVLKNRSFYVFGGIRF